MYDFRLPLAFVTMAIVVVGGEIIGGELSAVEKSLQFEAAFQGKFIENENTINWGLDEKNRHKRIDVFKILC